MVSSAALGWEPYREHKALLHDNRVCVHILRSARYAALCWSAACLQCTFISRLAHVYVLQNLHALCTHVLYVVVSRTGQFSTAILVYWALLPPLGSRLERNSILTCLPTSRLDRSNQFFFAQIHFCNILVLGSDQKLLKRQKGISEMLRCIEAKLKMPCKFYKATHTEKVKH